MKEKNHEVSITVGNRTYSIITTLDESVLNRILDNIEEAFSDANGDQEKRLLSACLDLSYRLDKVNREFEELKNQRDSENRS